MNAATFSFRACWLLFLLGCLPLLVFSQEIPSEKSLKKELKRQAKSHKDLIKTPETSFEAGIYYAGLLASYEGTLKNKYFKSLLGVGGNLQWRFGTDPTDPQQHMIAQTYLDMYRMSGSSAMTAFYELGMDSLRSNQGQLVWQSPEDWFAAAPALAKLAGITGRQSYLDRVQRGFEQLQAQHWDKEKELWGKEDAYAPMATAWMLMGACRMYRELPAEDPWQQQVGDHIRLLAERLKSLQQTNGHWPVDLSKPTGQGTSQAEATLPLVYGLAVALQSGILSQSEYESVILRGWEASEKVPPTDPVSTGLRMLAARELLGL